MATAVPQNVDRAWMSTATTGVGTITLGSALSGYQSFAGAGVTGGATVRYVILDGANWEIGTGVYTTAGTTLTRGPEQSSNLNAAINLSGSATVFVNVPSKDLVTRQVITLQPFDELTTVVVGDGAAGIRYRIPAALNGMDLVAVAATVLTAGTTGTTDIQIARIRSGIPVDMLSTKITIDSAETDTLTALTAAVINTANDDVQTGDLIRIDVDAVQTVAPMGLIVELSFHKP